MNASFASRMNGLQASAIREILKFTADPEVISFAAGNPAPEAFPVDAVSELTAKILKDQPITALQYGVTEGYAPLRELLKSDLKTRHGLGESFDDLIITSGAQQAIELSCKVFCNPGDTLLCENPSFIGSLNSFRSYEVNLCGVPVESDGINIDALEEAMKQNPNAKLLYVIPNFQNPSGVTMSLEKRKAVYALCVKYGVMILEDNPYGELRFAGEEVPSIKSLDTEGIVLYVGSFSKVLSPGLRVGYLLAPSEVIQKVVVCKQGSDVHSAMLSQMICHSFMNDTDFIGHLASLRAIYRHKSSLMIDGLRQYLNPAITFDEPEGGLFLWCKLPDGVDMPAFCLNAVKNKVAVVPGSAFMPRDTDKTQCFRLNYSTPTDEQLKKGVKILGELSHSLL